MLKTTSQYLKSLALTSFAVVVDETRARANIQAMADKARRSGVAFRPHFKTHQSTAAGRWFADEGVDRITVSSVPMAEHFAESGWTDITVAFLLNPLELPRIRTLAAYLDRRGGRLGVTVDSVAAAATVCTGQGFPVDVWLKIDTGYGRTGLPWDAPARVAEALGTVHGSARPAGLLTHTGHSYAVRDGIGLDDLFAETVVRMKATREAAGRPDLKISIGDTPSCSVVEDFTGVDEIRPGNFVFNDLMQLQIGSCTEDRLAAGAACPVVGLYPERNQVVVHGGAVHLSRESLQAEDGRMIFGRLGTLGPDGLGRVLSETQVVSLSQEHGVIECTEDFFRRSCGNLEIGDLVLIWPVHSCLMCDLQRDFITVPPTCGRIES